MTHLGIRITSLADGRLALDAADRAHAHLTGCAECRGRLAAEQQTKLRLTGLGAPPPSGDLLARLLELAAPGGPVPPRPGHVPGTPRPQPLLMPSRPPGRAAAALRGVSSRPAGRRLPGVRLPGVRLPGRTQLRITAALVGTLCLVGAGVAVSAVDGASLPLPANVTPDQLVIEHATTFRTIPISTPISSLASLGGTKGP